MAWPWTATDACGLPCFWAGRFVDTRRRGACWRRLRSRRRKRRVAALAEGMDNTSSSLALPGLYPNGVCWALASRVNLANAPSKLLAPAASLPVGQGSGGHRQQLLAASLHHID